MGYWSSTTHLADSCDYTKFTSTPYMIPQSSESIGNGPYTQQRQINKGNYLGSIASAANQGATSLGGLAVWHPDANSIAQIQNEINKKASEIAKAQQIMDKPKIFIKPKEKKHMFGFAKEYLDKHKDTVMTILVALFVDHFFLGGALRGKIKAIVENSLDRAQKHLSATPALDGKDATKSAT